MNKLLETALTPLRDHFAYVTSRIKIPPVPGQEKYVKNGETIKIQRLIGSGAEHDVYASLSDVIIKLRNWFGEGWQPNSPETDIALHEKALSEAKAQGKALKWRILPTNIHRDPIIFRRLNTVIEFIHAKIATENPTITPEDPNIFTDECLKYSDILADPELQEQLFEYIEYVGAVLQNNPDFPQHPRGIDLLGGDSIKDLLKAIELTAINFIKKLLPVESVRLEMDLKLRNVLYPKETRPLSEKARERFPDAGEYLTIEGELLLPDTGLHNLHPNMPWFSGPVIRLLSQLMNGLTIEVLKDLNPKYKNHQFKFQITPTNQKICEFLYQNFMKNVLIKKDHISATTTRPQEKTLKAAIA